jgi:hypothetical protein
MLLVVIAAATAAMVLTSTVAVAYEGTGEVGLQAYCDSVNGTMQFGGGQPRCLYNELTPGIPAQHGFTLTSAQEVTLDVTSFNNDLPPTPTSTPPTIVSCQNPQGHDVSLRNPNCTQAV